jgi:hypothetical protein
MGWRDISRECLFGIPPNQHRVVAIPRYDSDISAAWLILDKLHHDYHDIVIANNCEEGVDRWFVTLTHIKNIGAPTLPLAICLAALKLADNP